MIIYFLGKKKITSASILRQELEGKRQKNLQTLYNIKEIKIAQLEKFFYENFQFLSKKLKKVNDTYLFLQQLPRFLIEFFSILILGSVIFFSSRNLDNSIVPLLAVYAASAFRILPSVNRVIQNFNQINFGKPSIDTLYDTFSNIKKDTNLYKTSNERISFESVELKNISFSYDERKQIIFNEINFHIKKGDFIGIVGPSGSGKSTFVNLICGLISPTKGEILINNNLNLNDITNEFLNFTGYLSQNTSLFDDTIKNNICLSDDQKKAFDEKNYQDVIKKAQLDDFIEKLPLKNDSIVGENGITLSGGQKQRVGIARALFKNPDLLIFDEPTSSLDNKTSEKLIQIIKDLNKYKSIILITHDENIVKNCNKIIYLDGKGNFNVK
jgi:ABC-type multidrug transport system fused ATPase/permease subunit